MISIFGSLYGFSTPLWLLAVPAGAALLVYAYLRRGQGQRVSVATLLLLRRLRRSAAARRKFVPPPRFFFELLLLLLLITGAAGLFREGKNQKIALLIDNSMSMSALEDGTFNGLPLLKQAAHEASSAIRSWSNSGRVRVYVTSPALKSLSPGFESPDEAAARLETIETVFAGDNLEAALGKVALDSGADKLLVFTDRHPAPPSSSAALLRNPLRDRITFNRVGNLQRRSQNIAVGNVALIRGSFQEQSLKLKVTISSYALEDVQVPVRLETVEPQSGEFRQLASKQISLQPSASETVQFDGLPARLSAFRVSIAPLKANAIKGDDAAYISQSSQGSAVALVSQFSAADLGLDKIPGTSFISLTPAQLESRLQSNPDFWSSSDAPSAAIFHRYCPAHLPERNALFILPPADNRLFPVEPEVNSAQVTRWLTSHPINSYLNYTLLTLKSLSPIRNLNWTSPLISTTAGAAAMVGEKNGHRFLVVGIEMLPFEGRNRPLLSVFTLNALKWLSDFSTASGYKPAWSTLKLEKGSSAYLFPRGGLILPGSESGFKDRITLERPGLIKLNSPGAGPQFVAINYFSEEESDTLSLRDVTIPAISEEAGRTDDRQLLAGSLGLFVLALVLMDLLFLARRGFGLRR